MFRPDEQSVVGGCGLHRRVGVEALEIGYWVNAAHTRRGYAAAAARALTEVALALPGIVRVEIHCDIANVASAAVPRGLGYRLDRVVDDRIEAPGEAGPLMVWVTERRPGCGS
jgi:RimJ/RimL family protein N-acetyltransferase